MSFLSFFFFFFKQKTAYEIYQCDWSSDVCSSDLYADTQTSSACGGAYFGNLASEKDYSITISKGGYTSTTFNDVSVSGQSFYTATFP